jgi:hypothetical protein
MSDGSRLHFIWNKSDLWQKILLTADESYKYKYWLNAEKGTILKNDEEEISYLLPPYSTVILYASATRLADNLLAEPAPAGYNGREIATIDNWDINAGDASVRNISLFDWRTKEEFKYMADDGIYSASFLLDSKNNKSCYLIDLGAVYFTADVSINGQKAGKRIYAPYELDITTFVREGENQLEIRVTPTQRNHSIGEALMGNPKYAQYKNLEKTLMPAGLLGPVTLKLVNQP